MTTGNKIFLNKDHIDTISIIILSIYINKVNNKKIDFTEKEDFNNLSSWFDQFSKSSSLLESEKELEFDLPDQSTVNYLKMCVINYKKTVSLDSIKKIGFYDSKNTLDRAEILAHLYGTYPKQLAAADEISKKIGPVRLKCGLNVQ